MVYNSLRMMSVSLLLCYTASTFSMLDPNISLDDITTPTKWEKAKSHSKTGLRSAALPIIGGLVTGFACSPMSLNVDPKYAPIFFGIGSFAGSAAEYGYFGKEEENRVTQAIGTAAGCGVIAFCAYSVSK